MKLIFVALLLLYVQKVYLQTQSITTYFGLSDTVTVRYNNFKLHSNTRFLYNETSIHYRNSLIECCSKCLKQIPCLGINYHRFNGTCILFDQSLRLNFEYMIEDDSYDFYEVESECTRNPGVCEHGSVCVPSSNGSFSCQWCFPPYSGKYCNESADETVPISMSFYPDILRGERSSCFELHKKTPITETSLHVIHPWRDERTISVLCGKGGLTLVGRIQSKKGLTEPVIHPSFTSLVQDSFHVTTDVLQIMHKLLRFKTMLFACSYENGTSKQLVVSKNTLSGIEVIRYMIGETSDRPNSCDGIEMGTDLHSCENWIDDLWSAPNVSSQARHYYKVMQDTAGKVFSAGNGTFGCFDTGSYTAFMEYNIWVQ